MNNQNFRPLS